MKLNVPGNASRTPVGVDVGTSTVKVVQMARRGSGWWVESALLIPRVRPGESLDVEEVARLEDVMDRRGFRGRKIVLGVPAQHLLTSTLELPPRTGDIPLEKIARMELARIHQRDAASFEFAQWEVPQPARGNNATNVMAVACTHQTADQVLDAFEQRGFGVEALDVQHCAAARACSNITGPEGMFAILDLGWSGCRIAILHRSVVVYARSLEGAGLSTLASNLQQRLQIAPDLARQILEEAGGIDVYQQARPHILEHFEGLLREVNVSLSYAAHQYPDASLKKLLLIGGGAELAGLREHLAEGLEPEVVLVKLSEVADCNTDPICRSPALVIAMGLARFGSS